MRTILLKARHAGLPSTILGVDVTPGEDGLVRVPVDTALPLLQTGLFQKFGFFDEVEPEPEPVALRAAKDEPKTKLAKRPRRKKDASSED